MVPPRANDPTDLPLSDLENFNFLAKKICQFRGKFYQVTEESAILAKNFCPFCFNITCHKKKPRKEPWLEDSQNTGCVV